MFCPQCGKDVIDGAVFCPKCGYRLDKIAAYEDTKSQDATTEYEAPQSYNEYEGQSTDAYSGPYSADGYSDQQSSNGYPAQQPMGYEQADRYEQQGADPFGMPYGQQEASYNTADPNWVSAPPFVDNFIRMYTQKYVEFNGRATRKEYWTYAIGYFIVMLLCAFISDFLFDDAEILINVFAVASLLPNLSLTVRRLHDSGRSGLWAVGIYVPFVNIAVFIFMFLASIPGPNQYGPLPVFDASRNLHVYK